MWPAVDAVIFSSQGFEQRNTEKGCQLETNTETEMPGIQEWSIQLGPYARKSEEEEETRSEEETG